MTHKIAIIGLGYVGLPLAVEFAKKYHVVGYDINNKRVNDLKKGYDATLEVSRESLSNVLSNTDNKGLTLTVNPTGLVHCNIYIVTVPTPVDKNKRPILEPLLSASQTVGAVLKRGDIVIYESTVYPGATEEDCVPVLERISGLAYNEDFFCGYSPERINPGDKTHTVVNIKKITSGSTPEAAKTIDALYASIITAGTHLAPSIKVAEAAKVIENSQRDINIAFVNELAKIFSKIDIDTHAVLEAAGTKWNFLPFKPGLVGGHCIGVDPYYLAQKAQEVGYHPEIILSGRRLNDSMGEFVATEVLKLMVEHNIAIKGSNVLMLGITFKENCPDIRNTMATQVYAFLKDFNIDIDVYDPWANPDEVLHTYKIPMVLEPKTSGYDAIIHVVAHKAFINLDLNRLKKENAVVYDVKGSLERSKIDKRL